MGFTGVGVEGEALESLIAEEGAERGTTGL